MSKTLLLEIGTEEIPSRFIPGTLEFINRQAADKLEENRIDFEDISTFGTPRRLTLIVKGVTLLQKDVVTEFKGPKWSQAFDANGNPTKAAKGFAKSKGVDFEDLEPRELNGVKYAFARKSEKGRPAQEILPGILPSIIQSIVFPKSMYWDNPSLKFARPIRWIVSLFGKEIIPFVIGKVESGRITRGHRFMGSKSIEIEDASEYLDKLYDNYVIVDQHKRKQKMLSGISSLEKEISGKADKFPELLEENLYLVEFPVPFYGTFDSDFLEIPEEVLTTTMIHHQKYLPVRDENGNLMPYFIGFSNNRAANMAIVREGNERVLKARLSDAAFFWTEDLKKTLSSRVQELKNVVYQEKLGSLYDKVVHTRNISSWICEHCGMAEHLSNVQKAGYISKSDLVTNMVYEFPELQGVMGREYALKNGESPEVAKAIEEQYLPRFSGDRLPESYPGALLGIAERTYNILSCFKTGLQVSSSQDPYGLRRSARTINELIWALGIDLDIRELFFFTAEELDAESSIAETALEFFDQRLFMHLKEKGYSHEMVRMSMSVISERPLQTLRLLDTLQNVKDEEWFSNLATAAVRVKNILVKSGEGSPEVQRELLKEKEEVSLYDSVVKIQPKVQHAVENYQWKELAVQLSELSPSITSFFDKVLVISDDEKIRENRLAILAACHGLLRKAGDLGSLNM